MDLNDILKPTFIQGLEEIKSWCEQSTPNYLRSIFNLVSFKDDQDSPYYVPPYRLTFEPYYPQLKQDQMFDTEKQQFIMDIATNVKAFDQSYLESLNCSQLFFLLEMYGGNLPAQQNENISIYDAYKIKAAKAVIDYNATHHNHNGNLLINVDLSGIQNFIYNITSSGALKNLRARSFYIELLSWHLIETVMEKFNLHQVNVLMNGGGSIYFYASKPENYKELINEIDYRINKWLYNEFNGILYVSIDAIECEETQIENNLDELLNQISLKIFEKKQAKFKSLIEQGEFEWIDKNDPHFMHCDICTRDDTKANLILDEEAGLARCPFCDKLSKLGNKIPNVKYIYATDNESSDSIQIDEKYYKLSDGKEDNSNLKFIIYQGSFDIINELSEHTLPVYSKTYLRKIKDMPDAIKKEIQKEKIALQAQIELADKKYLEEALASLRDDSVAGIDLLSQTATGVKYVAGLRMDVDNLGKIMQKGFGNNLTFESLSNLSRNLNYYFKLFLNALCSKTNKSYSFLNPEGSKKNLQVIYAGGDDLFVIGAWNDVAQLSLEITQTFEQYVCNNIDIGISGGFTVHHSKYPINKMAHISMNALLEAKNNLQPCWTCRQEFFTCPLFKDGSCLRKSSLTPFFTDQYQYWKKSITEKLKIRQVQNYQRLELALKSNKYNSTSKSFTNEIQNFVVEPLQLLLDLNNARIPRHFFQVALKLLQTWYNEGMLYLPQIIWLLTKMSEKLRQNKDLNERSLNYFHIYDLEKFASMHIPLTWCIYVTKSGGNHNEL